MRQGYDNAGVARGRFVDGDAVFYRARFGIGTGAIDVGEGFKLGAQFTPQAAGVFGSLGSTIADVSLGLHEGYGRVARKYVRLDFGRFELNYGDALVLGNLDWNEIGRSFDGVRTRFSGSPTSAWVDLFATVVKEGRQAPVPFVKAGDGDQYLLGAYAALGPAIKAGLDLDVYLLTQVWGESQRTGPAGNTAPGATPGTYKRDGAAQATLGARAKQKIKIFDYRVEAGLQFGKRVGDLIAVPVMPSATQQTSVKAVDALAYQADLELGLAAIPDKLRFSLEGLYASGDNTTSGSNPAKKNEGWDELFPTAHKWLGLSDAFVLGPAKRTNVISGVLHITAVPVKNLTVQLDGHLFSRPEKMAAAAPTPGPMAMPAKPTSGYAGSEIDVGVSYQLVKGLKARAMYAAFMPGSDFYPTATARVAGKGKDPDPVHFLEVELRYDL
jgi:hypothetical protein